MNEAQRILKEDILQLEDEILILETSIEQMQSQQKNFLEKKISQLTNDLKTLINQRKTWFDWHNPVSLRREMDLQVELTGLRIEQNNKRKQLEQDINKAQAKLSLKRQEYIITRNKFLEQEKGSAMFEDPDYHFELFKCINNPYVIYN